MQHPKEKQRNAHEARWREPAAGPVARIDEFLIERHALRSRVENLLDALPLGRKPTVRLLKALRQEAIVDGDTSIRALVEMYLAEPVRRRANLLARVLESLSPDTLAPVVRNLLATPELLPLWRDKLEQLLLDATTRTQTAPQLAGEPARARVYYAPAELLENYLQSVENLDTAEPEVVGIMWLHGFRELPVESRIGLIQALAQRPDPLFIPALEIEARRNEPEVRRAVATVLPAFPFKESLDLALHMRFDNDVIVRYDAAKAEQVLVRHGDLPRAAPEPQFSHAYAIGLPGAGIVGVLYATSDESRCIKFCSLLIDTWHRGIVEAWGNVNCSEDQFSEVLLAFISRMAEDALVSTSAEPQFQMLSRADAIELIQSGARLTQCRGRRLPAEYPVWARLFRDAEVTEEEVQASLNAPSLVDEFIFDLHCSECTRPIAANRQRTNLAISGGRAFCKRCLNRKRSCTACGQQYRLAGLSSRRLASAAAHARCQPCVKQLR